MIRLLCLSNENINTRMPDPVAGEEYTAVDDATNDGHEFWLIDELQKPNQRNWYLKSQFIPLDGPDEAERIDQVMEKIFISKKNKEHYENITTAPARNCT